MTRQGRGRSTKGTTMTDDTEVQQRRTAAYRERDTLLGLRGALLDAAEASGVAGSDPLPPPLATAYEAYSARITGLTAEIAELDRLLAAEEVPQ